MENLPRPTDAELEILTVLWSRGACTVREIHKIIALRRPTQYTTVLKRLQIMAEKGLVRREEKQRAHVYKAARPVNGRKSSSPAMCCSAGSRDRRRACCRVRSPTIKPAKRNWPNCADCSTGLRRGRDNDCTHGYARCSGTLANRERHWPDPCAFTLGRRRGRHFAGRCARHDSRIAGPLHGSMYCGAVRACRFHLHVCRSDSRGDCDSSHDQRAAYGLGRFAPCAGIDDEVQRGADPAIRHRRQRLQHGSRQFSHRYIARSLARPSQQG